MKFFFAAWLLGAIIRVIAIELGIEFAKNLEWYYWLGSGMVLSFILYIFVENARREELMQKYNDSDIVESIINNEFWQGMTEEQLIDSKGKPIAIEENVLKTKVKETWKYDEQAKNRYALKILLENGIVIGWDKK